MMEDRSNIINSANPEICRELGKQLYFDKNAKDDERSTGLKMLIRAANSKDLEAQFIFGFLLLSGSVKLPGKNNVELGLQFVCSSANSGYLAARTFLNRYTSEKYAQQFSSECVPPPNSPLRDFDGKPFVIKRSGRLTPIDATLEFVNGKNILTLAANISFLLDGEMIKEPELFCQAILDGFREWKGEYKVFGNQALTVRVELTTDTRLFDNVFVIPMTKDMQQSVQSLINRFGIDKAKKRTQDIIKQKRSFAAFGIKKWSVRSRKMIYILSENDLFDDYDEIKSVAKHEFGHALGLGDLYYDETEALYGVEQGTYRELDSYYIGQNAYNLVMCDHHGPISNNDIEMIVLAFSENRMQNYQRNKIGTKISKALGRGN